MGSGSTPRTRDLKRFLVPKTNFTVFQQRLFREDQSDLATGTGRGNEQNGQESVFFPKIFRCGFNGGDDT